MESPEVAYIEDAKDWKGEIPQYGYVLRLKRGMSFGEFIEGIAYIFPYSDYAGFHASDPNWYEEGGYETGLLHPEFFLELEQFFRRKDRLKEDQVLGVRCHYSANPGTQDYIFSPGDRPNLVIQLSGGEHDSWGQFMCCVIPNSEDFLEKGEANSLVSSLRKMKGAVG